jgi:predicted TIM-barrel fold metal-dependent hydrolase
MIVDCHTHWGMCWEEKCQGDPSEWLAVLDRHGVRKAFLYGHANLYRVDFCKNDNDLLAQVSSKSPDRLIPVATSWPQMEKDGVKEVRRCIETLGIRHLKFHPWLQGFSTADRYFGEICSLAGECHMPIFLHDGTPCYSLSEQIAGLAKRFPSTTFVLAHSGLLWAWRSAIEAARYANVRLCLCGPSMRAMELLSERVDPGRLLWGSDYGFSFADSINYRLGLFLRSKIKDSLKEQILEINPLDLLKPS